MENKKKSKAPVIIIIVAAVIVIAAAVFAILFFSGAFKNKTETQPTTAQTTTVEDNTVQAIHGQVETAAQTSDAESSQAEETTVVIVPTEAEGDITYFSGTYAPNGTVIDTFTGQSATLKEIFGNGYNTEGKLTFNEDGTFSDTLPSKEGKNGAYVVQNGKISATYSDDRNMDITVTEWNGGKPASFYVVYAGYNVYFG